jgi:mono/diheme cytochrome c family protein
VGDGLTYSSTFCAGEFSMRRVTRVALLAGCTVALTAASVPILRGGWAILTVHDLPESLEAGRPTTIQFSLRQHGEEMMAGRVPVVQLRSGNVITGKREEIRAERTRTPGVYRASFTPSGEGELRVSVDTDYHGFVARLLPMQVGARNAASAQERGRALYVAKGCVGCHTKNDDAALSDFQEMRVGPDLTGRSYPAQWLVQKITDPASLRPAGPRAMNLMPQLEVSAAEAQAIASYLNARTVATRE